MKRELLTVAVSLLLVIVMAVLANIDALTPERYVWGRIRIQERGIYAEVYTTVKGSDCIPTLWNGGKVTVDADLSDVQVGDMADLRGLDGEHYVMECIDIRRGIALLMEPHGDVLVINGRWVYRFTRL